MYNLLKGKRSYQTGSCVFLILTKYPEQFPMRPGFGQRSPPRPNPLH